MFFFEIARYGLSMYMCLSVCVFFPQSVYARIETVGVYGFRSRAVGSPTRFHLFSCRVISARARRAKLRREQARCVGAGLRTIDRTASEASPIGKNENEGESREEKKWNARRRLESA